MKIILCFLILNVAIASDKLIKVRMETSKGDIEIELNQSKAPISVKNFLSYVDSKFFEGTIFHRVIDNFMIQGGGFDKDLKKKATEAPIKNEANNGLKNDIGTIAMARTSDINSATSQFFINVKNNDFLNHQGSANYGYAVFGKVSKGMSVLNLIKKVKTSPAGGHGNVPIEPIVIKSIKRI